MASSSSIVKLTRLSSSSSWYYRTCRKRPRSFLTFMEQRSSIINGTIGSSTTGGRRNGTSATTIAAKRYFSTATTDLPKSTLDRRISIGDVQVETPPLGSGRSDLVPSLFSDHYHDNLSSCQMGHLRWMLQKDLCLKQDFLLLGSAALARDRRHLLLLYAALIEREVEYMALSRDTSDADLKQRKEVFSSTDGSEQSSSAVYIHQAPVRAALHGRLLILDGLEKAERNVLPTLNNLLENRELSLDDGGLLISSQIFDEYAKADARNGSHNNNNSSSVNVNGTMIHRVHPDFRVAALASDASVLDPPLRSRFQARVLHPLNPGDILQYLMSSTTVSSTTNNNSVDIDMVTKLIHLTSSIPEDISLQSLENAVRYLECTPNNLRNKTSIVNAYTSSMLRVEDYDMSENTKATYPNNAQSSFISTSTTDTIQDMISCAFDSGTRAVALVGPKGSYKSALARDFIKRNHQQHHQTNGNHSSNLFSLYSDMTSRDLLCTRGTDSQGNTIWNDTPLTKAIKHGSWIILDGIDKVRSDTLTSLALLMEQGFVDLPNGSRLTAHSNFKCIALAHPPEEGGSDDNQKTWITPEVKGMFHWIRVNPYPSKELYNVLRKLYPSVDSKLLEQLVQLRDRLDQAIQTGAADTTSEQETLMLSMRKLKHICKRLNNNQRSSRGQQQQNNDNLLRHLIENAMMIHLMPDREQRIIRNCMNDCGIAITDETDRHHHKKNLVDGKSSLSLDEELLSQHRRSPQSSASSTNSLLIPRPIFEENPGHALVLRDLLEAHSVGEEALLIMGYQGVGKNRVVDYLLQKLQYEREYLQLHRDTTVQSLLVTPTIHEGRILYEDSPLVRAAIHGRILIMDEADKAPLEVVALLNGLIEDRELALPDGRTLRYKDDLQTGKGSTEMNDSDNSNDNKVIPIHSNFRIWALANPSTYPFHGNDISREMSDVFSCHLVPPLDIDSQRRILTRYGPNVISDNIDTILNIWNDLRVAHEKGILAYPFSVREAVSVVKHLNLFPNDGLDGALENVIAFDRFDNITLKQLSKIFHKYGITTIGKDVDFDAGGPDGTNREGGISTPRTRASMPKHGKVDPHNEPHVGGNTWAGGTGGSDTAGLGGQGGPYRLDLGHKVHQVSDEMKAQVSEEAQRQAQQMARDGLTKKLNDLNMGELDWERYNHLQERVAPQIQQLRLLLKDIQQKRQFERIWIKRQSSGELDDSRIVDALVGEKDVFQKRGIPTEDSRAKNKRHSSKDKMLIKLVVDISASMYRFNGYDGRLQTLLEATLMIMEAFKDDDRFLLEIVGHNGDSPDISLVEPTHYPKDPKTQLQILESMVAHTQYTFSGDHTVEAIEVAVSKAKENDLIVVISDANLQRYRIDPHEIGELLTSSKQKVHAHLVLIGNFGEEAHHLSRVVPNQRAQVCLDSQDLPMILKTIVASAAK